MSSLEKLRLVSYLAPNLFWFYQAVGAYLGRILRVETQIVQSQYDPLKDLIILQDQLDIAFICGLPFAQLNQLIPGQLKAIVAPVMQAMRYQNSPVYFADIIVNANSNIKTFNALVGKTLCYNDLGSNSGYNMIRQRLMQSKYPSSFFGKAIQSGSHQNSIKLIVDHTADCAAIDSTVLEQELRDSPGLVHYLRVIESIGPCPMPPVVAAQRLGEEFISLIQSALCKPDTEMQSALEQAQIQRYVAVQSEDYAAIAQVYEAAIKAGYQSFG